ncbi:RNA polymerase sigma factor [Neobacillus thermocopriae]|uniref:RNA polymerase sigma factor n=1 Tax=Neobacillus thermocopriae TaxID=1215031 RepID=UPI002E241F80|nr:sigma-70 family RNA polymerase sigma factor [Neobacillus thermocopriae]MED3715161.1 sigma-70 family RNA polymerase sigma factor [Neobacillus thermocopriae]
MPDRKKDGKKESIEEICYGTWKSIYQYIYYKVQNREEAEDITQETYVKAISYLQNGSVNPDKYIGFLKTVALNVMRDLWRKKKRRGPVVDIDTYIPKENAVEDHSEDSTERLMIEHALTQLNEEQRTVIELRILKGFSVAETAGLMNKKEGTIRVIQHRALKNLANILKSNNLMGGTTDEST